MCMHISRKGRMVMGVVIVLSLMVLEVKAQTILRVDVSSTCTTVDDPCDFPLTCGDASNWSDAFTKLEDAIAQAKVCGNIDEIWVAAGTYVPDPCESGCTDTDSESSFELIDGVGLFGGFAGGEDRRAECVGGTDDGDPCLDVADDSDCSNGDCVDQRNFVTNETTLSGDLEDDDSGFTNNDENSYHILTYSDASATGVVLDGFTVEGGNADGGGVAQTQGSGLQIRKGSFCDGGTNDGNLCTEIGIDTDDCPGAGASCKADKCIAGGPMVRNCIFKENSADNHGAVNDHGLTSIFEDCTFKDNIASKGAGMLVQHGSPEITRCVFDGNSTNALPNEGGGLWLSHDTDETCTGLSAPTITGTTFSNNYAKEGGGIWSNNSDPAISNCTFTSNESDGVDSGGSGIWSENATSAMTVNNCTFLGNNSEWRGSSIYLLDSDTIVDNCNFTNNTTCKHYSGCNYYGGTIYIKGGTPHIKGSVFDSNVAGYLWGAHSGGALYITNTPKIGADILTIEKCVFIDNSAVYAGGSAFLNGTTASSWINCIFSGNSANHNTSGYGGAIYHGSSGDIYFTNCTFSKNEAQADGGGIYVGGSATIVNCIFWDNKDTLKVVSDEEAQIYETTSFLAAVTDTDWMNYTGSEPTIITDNPEFEPTSEYGLHLKSISPCIDDGDNDALYLSLEDFDGNCRIENVTVDMGAYEQSCSVQCCSGVCYNCCNNGHCSSPTPVCDTGTHTCEECVVHNDCPDVCCSNVCVTGDCCSNSDCSAPTPFCKIITNTCVECRFTFDCGSCKICIGGVCVADPTC